MEVSKLKNIVIVILVLLNLCLLALSGGRRMQDARSYEQARDAAMEVIRTGGINLDERIVPMEMNLTPLVAERDLKAELIQARDLLGGEVEMQAKGGEVYRYTNESGWLQVHGTGQYTAQLSPGVAPLGQAQPESHAVALLETLGMQSCVSSNHVVDGRGTVVLNQTLNGTKILDCQVSIQYQDGCAVQISGNRRLLGQAVRAQGTPITVATALMRLYNGLNDLGDVYSSIQSITPAYFVSAGSGGTMRLIPVWQVETDTGHYRLDTLTGELSRTGIYVRQMHSE